MTTIVTTVSPAIAKKFARLADAEQLSHEQLAPRRDHAVRALGLEGAPEAQGRQAGRQKGHKSVRGRGVSTGAPGVTPGICRFCRCSHFNPCPEGCWWADRAETLCSACVDVDAAWRKVKLQQLPNMRRAFYRGFQAAQWQTEAQPAKNPYQPGRTALYWQIGFTAGEKALAA